MGNRKQHQPTTETRQMVMNYTMTGVTQDQIAKILQISIPTLCRYYREELDLAKPRANATIAAALFNKAKNGDTTAMIFWLKTQAGWREKVDVDQNTQLTIQIVEVDKPLISRDGDEDSRSN